MFVGVRLGIPLSTARGVPLLPGQLLGGINGTTALTGSLALRLSGGTIAGSAVISGTMSAVLLPVSLSGTITGSATLTGNISGNHILTALPGAFLLTGDTMTPQGQYVVQMAGATGANTFTLSGKNANLTKPPPPFTLTYQSSVTSNANLAITDYGALGYGAGADRTICVIQAIGGSTHGVASVTVGGQAFSQVPGAFGQTSADITSDVWISNAPLTGTSGHVVVTYNSATTYTTAVALYNLKSANTIPGDPGTIGQGNAAISISSAPINIQAGGGAVWASFPYGGSASPTMSANAVVDATPAAAGVTFYFGHTVATGEQVVTMTYSSNDTGVMLAVPWGPTAYVGPQLEHLGGLGVLSSYPSPNTATAIPIGPPSATRLVIMVMVGTGIAPSTMTWTPAGGGSINPTVVATQVDGTSQTIVLYQAVVAVGATMDISYTYSQNPFGHCWHQLWSCDTSTMTSTTATTVKTSHLGSFNTASGPLTVSPNGFMILISSVDNGSVTASAWSGGGEYYIPRHDSVAFGSYTSIFDVEGAIGGSETPTVTFTGGSGNVSFLCATWR